MDKFQKGLRVAEELKVCKTVEEAITFVKENFSSMNPAYLAVDDSLQDPSGMNMAIIVNEILAFGLLPEGFEQKEGYRVYKYKK